MNVFSQSGRANRTGLAGAGGTTAGTALVTRDVEPGAMRRRRRPGAFPRAPASDSTAQPAVPEAVRPVAYSATSAVASCLASTGGFLAQSYRTAVASRPFRAKTATSILSGVSSAVW